MKKAGRIILRLIRLPRQYDLLLVLSCLVLSVVGIIFIGSASITSSTTVMRDVTLNVAKQSAFLIVSLIVMNTVSHYYTFARAKALFRPAALAVLVLLLACLGFTSRNNTRAWISIPFINATIQPAEFAKIIMIFAIAIYLCYQPRNRTFWELVKRPVLLAGAYIFIIWVLQNDFGSAAVLGLITFLCLLIPSHHSLTRWHKLLLLALALAVFLVMFACSPLGRSLLEHLPLSQYQIERFEIVSEPFTYIYGNGYQVCNSLIAFTRGGLLGRGLGQSVQKFGYLPYAGSDFIIAVIAEEGGMLVLSGIFFLYFVIEQRLLSYALKMRRQENKVILFGAASYLFIHFLLNVGGAIAMIPLTGVPLLMLSSGGTSLVSWYAMVGIAEAIIASYRRGEDA